MPINGLPARGGTDRMGVALALVFDKNVPEARAFAQYTDGKDIARAMDRFDAICAARGVPPLSALAGPDEDELEALADELAAGERVPDRWFGCAAGLRTVRAVVAALRSEREWSKG